jgi:hypothetical protein
MAKALLVKFTEKSACCMVPPNKFAFSRKPVYLDKDAFEGIELGTEVEIPDGYTFIPMLDKDKNPRTTKPDENGEVHILQTLTW